MSLRKWIAYTTMVTALTATFGFTNGSSKTVTYKQKPAVPNVEIIVAKTSDKPKVMRKLKTEFKQPTQYLQVTAQYLNVRNVPHRKGKIEDVLVYDYVVVSDRRINGWAKIGPGQYINTKFTRILTKEDGLRKLAIQKKKKKPHPVFRVFHPEPIKASTVKKAPVQRATTQSGGHRQMGVLGTSNISANQFNQLVAGTGLAGIGDALVAVERQYGINGLFTLAVAKLESGHGQSALARNKNNIFGMNAVDSNPYNAAYTYNTKADSILDFGSRMKKNYINQGLTTLATINRKYSSSSEWAGKVQTIMTGDFNKVQ